MIIASSPLDPMDMMARPEENLPVSHSMLTRWYIDTRPLTAKSPSLPFCSTLQPGDQKTVNGFRFLHDKHMSLASYLLKYLFIHRACRVPWNQIVISRTPAPHRRPCYIPIKTEALSGNTTTDNSSENKSTPDIEFNVSHQGSLVSLAGCFIPDAGTQFSLSLLPGEAALSSSSAVAAPQIGIDITCTEDPTRRRADNVPKTEEEIQSFIDIFAEVFSQRELGIMKTASVPDDNWSFGSNGVETKTAGEYLQRSIRYRHRLFYTYWALKEAYIKMTGEALLAPWLRDLEFTNVVVPHPVATPSRTGKYDEFDDELYDDSAAFGTPETGIQIWFRGKRVEDVRVEVVAFEKDYLIATAGRGGALGKSAVDPTNAEMAKWDEFRRVDVERDIGACAMGNCRCLES